MPYRVFLSSPSDVMAERALCADVVARINSNQSPEDQLEVFRWEEQYYSATDTFQTQIPRAGDCDIVICIFWKALGTELPAEYRRDDGTTRTGSEFEFEDAITAAEASTEGLPDILVYKKNQEIFFSEQDLEREQLQYKSFKQFWQRWFYSEKGHFLAAFHTFKAPEEFAALIESHLRQWLRNRAREVTWRSGSPYPGLRSFDVPDAPIFFGRRQEIERLRARLIRAAMAGRPFLLVSGPSGSGKSSLVRAGLIPRLAAPGGLAQLGTSMRWALLTPSQIEADPHLGLAEAFFADAALGEALAAGDFDTAEALAGLLRVGGATALAPLLKALDRVDAADDGLISPATKLFVLVDQLEELFKWAPEKAEEFLGLIDALVGQADGRFFVAATMRSDFVHLTAGYPVLNRLTGRDEVKDENSVDTTLEVAAIGAADLRDIIRLPARAAGLTFEADPETGEDLAQLIEAEASPSLLPAVQYLLSELYERRDETVLTRAAYRELGGVRGVMAERGEAVLGDLDAEARSAVPQVFRGLVKFDTGDGPPTARRLPVDAFPPGSPAARLILALTDARLIITDGKTLRLAHESLFDGWDRLQHVAEQDRRMLGIRDRLLPYAQRFAEAGTRSERRRLLLRGFQLAEGRELQKNWGEESLAVADPALPRVIHASDRAEKRRRFAQIAGAWGLVAIFALFSVGLYYQWDRAESQRVQTLASLEVVQAQNALSDGRLEAAARHALTGYDLVPSQEHRSVLLQTLLEISPNLVAVRSLPATATALAFVDNDTVAVAEDMGLLRYLSVSGDAVPEPVALSATPGFPDMGQVRTLSALPGGEVLAVLSNAALMFTDRTGSTVMIEGPKAGDTLMPGPHSVAFRRGEPMTIAVATFSSGLALAMCRSLDDPDSCAWQVRPDHAPPAVVALGGGQLVTASLAYPYEISIDRAEATETVSAGEDRIIALDVSANGDLIATGSETGTLRIHADDLSISAEHHPSQTTLPILRWSPTEPILALVCDDRDICINRAPASQDSPFERFTGHREQITGLTWSPDGARLASISADGTLRIWSLDQVPGPRRVLAGTGVGLPALATDATTGKLAAGTDDGSVLVWAQGTETPDLLPAPDGLSGKISALVWTSDGQLAGAVGDTGDLVRWRVDGGAPLVTKLGAGFQRLAAVGADGSVAVPLRDGRVVRVDAQGNKLALAAPPFDGDTRPIPWGALADPDGTDVIVSYTDGSYARHPLDGSDPDVFLTLDDTKIAIGAGSLSASSAGASFAASQGDYAVSVYPLDGVAGVIHGKMASRDTRVVAFEPAGDRLAVLGSDGWLYVYRLKDGDLVQLLALDPIASRSRAGRSGARGRSAQWLDWAAPGVLAVSTAAGDVHLISLDEDLWERRVGELVRQTDEEEP